MKKITTERHEFVLRPFEPQDQPHFLQLGSQTCGSLHKRINQSESDLRERFKNFVRDFAFRPESEIYVVQSENGTYAGHIWLTETTNRFNGIKELWIWDLTVTPEFRKQGLGRALMTHAKECAKKQNCEELWLLVAEENEEAQRLYASQGMMPRARMLCLDMEESQASQDFS
ncbi:GNAT family N-acetyltransferase [bacterium]|nr:GNAT family N-acetyltransferase [bacterium]